MPIFRFYFFNLNQSARVLRDEMAKSRCRAQRIVVFFLLFYFVFSVLFLQSAICIMKEEVRLLSDDSALMKTSGFYCREE